MNTKFMMEIYQKKTSKYIMSNIILNVFINHVKSFAKIMLKIFIYK